MDALLHGENLTRIPLLGQRMKRRLAQRINETRGAAAKQKDPGVSIVIRAKDNARQLEGLLQDVRAQNFAGKVEIIVVDTESRDDSVDVAQKFGAKVIPITQADFTYPKALNYGFQAATKPWVFSWVDHSALSSSYLLKVATRWNSDPHVAGVWAYPLPNVNATRWELFGYLFWVWRGLPPAHSARKRETGMGFLGANSLLIRRSVWQEVGGFDERFAAGGEDSALGNALLRAGYQVLYDPALSVYHSHGLGLVGSLRQFRYWQRVMRPTTFDLAELRRYRSDL